jgi:hypothetical protein
MVRLPHRRSADKLPTVSRYCLLSVSIDQLDKADAPLIPEAFIYLLGVQCLVSLSDGLARYTSPLYNTIAVQKPPAGSIEAPRARAHSTLLRCPTCPKPSLPVRDAERSVACASCGPLLPPYHEPLRLHLR